MLSRFNNKDLLDFLEQSTSPFLNSLYNSVCKFGKLSEKQEACAIKAFNDFNAKREQVSMINSGLIRVHAQVIKGGKNGCDCIVNIIVNSDIKHDIKEGYKFSLVRASNTKKGDLIGNVYIDPVTLKVVYDNAYITRYNPHTRQSCRVYIK
jgi:hypothetical protein